MTRAQTFYFAHPVTLYDRPAERAIGDAFRRRFPQFRIENPNKAKHAAAYQKEGMQYFMRLTGELAGAFFTSFANGKVGAGVAKEVEGFLARGAPVYWYDPARQDFVAVRDLSRFHVLSVDETRALLALERAQLRSGTDPYGGNAWVGAAGAADVARPPAPRMLPDPAPLKLKVGDKLFLKKVAQTPDMLVYVSYIQRRPTYYYVMNKLDEATALDVVPTTLKQRRAVVVLDRDGVIKDSRFLNEIDKAKTADVMIDSALDACKALNEANVGAVVATNQAGFETGKMTLGQTVGINVRVVQQVADRGGHIDAVLICPFNSKLPQGAAGVDARKPSPGMPAFVVRLAAKLGIPVLAMIGDQRTDGAAGQGAGLPFHAVTDDNGRWRAELEAAKKHGETLPALDLTADRYVEGPDFRTAVQRLLARLSG